MGWGGREAPPQWCLIVADVFVGFCQVDLFVGLDHQLVQNDDVGIRKILDRLQT